MTHGYEWLFEYDMVDLDDYYVDIEDWSIDEDISESWGEIEEIYDIYENEFDNFDWGF